MTQEELDALMSGDIDDLESLEDDDISDASVDEDAGFEDSDEKDNGEDLSSSNDEKPLGYSPETAHHWPLPATNENKMVHQLDDVTKESEEKASEIFDIIEGISNNLLEEEKRAEAVIEVLESNIELFKTLSSKFPDVEAFKVQLEKNNSALSSTNEALETLQSSGNAIMDVMDIMQYQDIHRQKIERVINVMRALSNYMNSLFEGKIDDEKRVSSAQHIVGDTHNELASNEDIEALLAQFGS
ncbi:chemotaxis protein [Sulfurimonas crateris]|uniref:Chemotaxis protein n=1 Tax=Sulfurimonas crateris TaxID=2574727 RepID=A0A4U2Z4S2_9BACT|nr:chemotaxis protein [Sulfurimonas crateris]TKI68755.1 chemotaxis protein [Sulfurimonas crateris]